MVFIVSDTSIFLMWFTVMIIQADLHSWMNETTMAIKCCLFKADFISICSKCYYMIGGGGGGGGGGGEIIAICLVYYLLV